MNMRYRPTPYMDLHLGSLWVAWRNWRAAARSGGRFVMIIDDEESIVQHAIWRGFSPKTSALRYEEDLEWFGISVDEIRFTSEFEDEHRAAWEKLGIRPAISREPDGYAVRMIFGVDQHVAAMDGYLGHVVANRVVDDALLHIDGFFRGMDLIGERELYDWFGYQLGYRSVRQEYIPLVRRENAKSKESKSEGNPSLRELKDVGYTAQEIIETLREASDRSVTAGFEDLVIPDGYLGLDEIRTLKWTGLEKFMSDSEKEARGKSWEDEVRQLFLSSTSDPKTGQELQIRDDVVVAG